jgi:hypothetical protein
MLRANHAVRLGLRAASRNPELAFAKALIDQAGNLLALVPVVLAALLVFASARGSPLEGALLALRTAALVRWPLLGAVVAALAILFLAGMLFWAGALPLLAADAELGRRPPAGNFLPLLSRGGARTLVAGALGWGIVLLLTIDCVVALLFGATAAVTRPSIALFAATAGVAILLLAATVLLDPLARLTMIRAAAFGDTPSAAFARASRLLGARLGACVIVTIVFMVLELIIGAIASMLTGVVSGVAFLRAGAQPLALAPRAAIGLAAAVVFAWLEVGRMGALAAIAADAEGLVESEQPVPQAELVVEALPADE